MRIEEAMDSGYAFKRRVHKEWVSRKQMVEKILIMSFDDVVADDWEINKPKKRYWRWVYRRNNPYGCWRVTLGYYDDNLKDKDNGSLFGNQDAYELCKLESDFIEV